jgi:hypothetical protein
MKSAFEVEPDCSGAIPKSFERPGQAETIGVTATVQNSQGQCRAAVLISFASRWVMP